jgi:hypothetical protein
MFTAGSYGSIVLGSACIEATKAGASSSNLDFLQTKKKIPVFHHHHLNVLFLFALRRKRRSMCAANSAPLIRRRERPWSARDATPLHTSNVLALYTAPITSVTSAKAKVADVALDFRAAVLPHGLFSCKKNKNIQSLVSTGPNEFVPLPFFHVRCFRPHRCCHPISFTSIQFVVVRVLIRTSCRGLLIDYPAE